jgi:hypothetical protein
LDKSDVQRKRSPPRFSLNGTRFFKPPVFSPKHGDATLPTGDQGEDGTAKICDVKEFDALHTRAFGEDPVNLVEDTFRYVEAAECTAEYAAGAPRENRLDCRFPTAYFAETIGD